MKEHYEHGERIFLKANEEEGWPRKGNTRPRGDRRGRKMTVPMNGLWKSEQRELEAIRELAQSNLVAAKQRAATWAKAAPTRRTLRQAFLRTVRGIYAHLK